MTRPTAELIAIVTAVADEAEQGTPVAANIVARGLSAAGELLADLAARVAALEAAAG